MNERVLSNLQFATGERASFYSQQQQQPLSLSLSRGTLSNVIFKKRKRKKKEKPEEWR
jgi:hypothetical protein